MLSSKQVAGNQKRSVRAMMTKIENMAYQFGDLDNWMAEQANDFHEAAEKYYQFLQEHVDEPVEKHEEDY